jgi:uncharacterized membrane protein YphA (DoxX/SURF4 family)
MKNIIDFILKINQKISDNAPKYAPVVVRVGIALVVLWFGQQQLSNPVPWLGVLPEWTKSLPVSQIGLIYFNGWFEIVTGLALLAGFYTRWVALLIALHLLDITITVGYGGVGARDLGLTLAAFGTFFYGRDKLSVDNIWPSDML